MSSTLGSLPTIPASLTRCHLADTIYDQLVVTSNKHQSSSHLVAFLTHPPQHLPPPHPHPHPHPHPPPIPTRATWQFGAPYSDIHLSRSWRGSCDLVDPAFACSLKLIGAKFYVAGLLAGNDTVESGADLYSPRDFNGHGMHTASTAGGNHGVPVEGFSPGVDYGAISGY